MIVLSSFGEKKTPDTIYSFILVLVKIHLCVQFYFVFKDILIFTLLSYIFVVKVTENTHRYLKDVEMREEGGTPAIIESVRAGLVFQLKSAVGVARIADRDQHLLRYSFSQKHLFTYNASWKKFSSLVSSLYLLSFWMIQYPINALLSLDQPMRNG